MSTINIVINTIGDLVKNKVTFKPSMSDVSLKSNVIFFPPTFILIDDKITKAVTDSSYVKEILTNAGMFGKLVKYYTDRAKGYKKISLEKAASSGIIEKNFEFMRNLWLKNNSQIMIEDRVYNIIKSSISNTSIPTDRSKLQFSMTVDVKLIRKDRDNMTNRQKISCDEQRDNINNIYETLYGIPFFGYRETSTKPQSAPVMYSSDKGSTTGRNQIASSYAPPQYMQRPPPYYLSYPQQSTQIQTLPQQQSTQIQNAQPQSTPQPGYYPPQPGYYPPQPGYYPQQPGYYPPQPQPQPQNARGGYKNRKRTRRNQERLF